MCILCECPAPTASFVCKCERGRESAQQRVIESYRFFYCLFFSALSSSFSSLAFIKPPWGDQTKMRKRSKSNTQKTVCATVELYYFDISASFELCALLCFVLFLLHPVKWMYSNRNVVIQWIKYVLCLIFMPFIHWHIHDIQTLHYFVALICHIRYIYVYFILFSVYRWLSFGPMCFFSLLFFAFSLSFSLSHFHVVDLDFVFDQSIGSTDAENNTCDTVIWTRFIGKINNEWCALANCRARTESSICTYTFYVVTRQKNGQ